MKEFFIFPKIILLDTLKEFSDEILFSSTDLVITSKTVYNDFLKNLIKESKVIFYSDYAKGEPTDILVEAIYNDIKDFKYQRVIGIGGGAILDIAKLFALEYITPVVDLFEKKIPAIKKHELLLVPTTCGTGSEVTNISILALTAKNTKFGLADKSLYADKAILFSDLLNNLPYKVFATSSIDALIHSFESFTSPKASQMTKMYSKEAIQMIIDSYKSISIKGEEFVKNEYKKLLLASTYAGIAFGNAGCAAVHAMSYPLGAKYHVPHGESNYVLFTTIYKEYLKLKPKGSIEELNLLLSQLLDCKKDEVYNELDILLNNIIKIKKMHEYGAVISDIDEFASSVMEKQTRLMQNNYTKLDINKVKEIYKMVF